MMIFDSAIYWPNGLGYTECTQAYADAIDEQRRLGGMREDDPDNAENDNAFFHAEQRALNLLADGHLGPRRRFEAPQDPLFVALAAIGAPL